MAPNNANVQACQKARFSRCRLFFLPSASYSSRITAFCPYTGHTAHGNGIDEALSAWKETASVDHLFDNNLQSLVNAVAVSGLTSLKVWVSECDANSTNVKDEERRLQKSAEHPKSSDERLLYFVTYSATGEENDDSFAFCPTTGQCGFGKWSIWWQQLRSGGDMEISPLQVGPSILSDERIWCSPLLG